MRTPHESRNQAQQRAATAECSWTITYNTSQDQQSVTLVAVAATGPSLQQPQATTKTFKHNQTTTNTDSPLSPLSTILSVVHVGPSMARVDPIHHTFA